MCILDVYSKIAHPFVMQYLVYFLASLTSLNAILLFKMCIRFKHREKTFNMSEANVIALPFHVKVFLILIIICCQIQSHHLVMLLHLMLIHNHHLYREEVMVLVVVSKAFSMIGLNSRSSK